MALKDLMNKAQELTGSAADTAGKFLDDFNEALPTMRALGFTVKDLRVGMGLLPEVSAKLTGSVEAINNGKLSELIARHGDKKLLVTLLKALQAAHNIKEQLGSMDLRGLEIDLKLGIPPGIHVDFLRAPAAAAAQPRTPEQPAAAPLLTAA